MARGQGDHYGSGIPAHFYCPNYRKLDWRTRSMRDVRFHHCVRTGNTEPRRRDGNQGLRTLDTRHEYVCEGCGHRGWTTHIDILQAPLQHHDAKEGFMPVRSEAEITAMLDMNDADAAAGGESQWPGMNYEQGVDAALRWAAGLTDESPVAD